MRRAFLVAAPISMTVWLVAIMLTAALAAVVEEVGYNLAHFWSAPRQ